MRVTRAAGAEPESMSRGARGVGALVAVLHASGALAAWTVNGRGECVQAWTPASLGRGPAAVLNAPLVPVRTAAGGVQEALDDRTPGGVHRKVILVPALAGLGGAMGLVEAGVWLASGLADTLTGGYFELAPDEATALSVSPRRPLSTDTHAGPRTDACGRPLG